MILVVVWRRSVLNAAPRASPGPTVARRCGSRLGPCLGPQGCGVRCRRRQRGHSNVLSCFRPTVLGPVGVMLVVVVVVVVVGAVTQLRRGGDGGSGGVK